jgi:hypothetical protein
MSGEYARRLSMIRKGDDQMNDEAIINYFVSNWLAHGYDSKAFEKLQNGILGKLKKEEKKKND